MSKQEINISKILSHCAVGTKLYSPVIGDVSLVEVYSSDSGSVNLSNLKGKTINDDEFLFVDSGAWVKDIVPIPLTLKILEKNGWKKDGKWYCLSTKRAYLYTIQDTGKPDEFLICAGEDKHNLTSVSFVHQLQHFLFGLNINSDLEV